MNADGSAALPAAYLTFACVNGGDANYPSALLVDAVEFYGRTLHLEMSAPNGPGSFRVGCRFGTPGAVAFKALTVAAPDRLDGWFYGVDIPAVQLYDELGAGAPFVTLLDATGADDFTLVVPSVNWLASSTCAVLSVLR